TENLVRVARVKVRVGVERELEVSGRHAPVPERALDHAGMKEETRVTRALAERLGHGLARRIRLPVLVERPREEVVGVDVAPDLELPAGQGERRVELRVVVEVEGR